MTTTTVNGIASVLRDHYFEQSVLGTGCGCNKWRGDFEDWHQHVAEQIAQYDADDMTVVEIDVSTWARLDEVINYAETNRLTLAAAIRRLVNQGLNYEQHQR